VNIFKKKSNRCHLFCTLDNFDVVRHYLGEATFNQRGFPSKRLSILAPFHQMAVPCLPPLRLA
jgi:hypothetical protein